jgi:cell division protease FtsH
MASDTGSRSRQQRADDPPPWRVEGERAPDPAKKDEGKGMRGFRPPGGGRNFLLIVLVILGLNVGLGLLVPDGPERNAVSYTYFFSQLEKGNVEEIQSQGSALQGEFKRAVTEDPEAEKPRREFRSFVPDFAIEDPRLRRELAEQRVEINARPLDSGRSFLLDFLLFFGPTILLVALFVFIARRASGGAAGITGMGRSKAKRYDSSQARVTFEDVAGIDEAEDELVEIVDFLRNPDKYRRLGAMIPKGVLLSGQPGTGKTLLARAVAGEADVPFFSMSASEFIEMVVGVGASRVRDLFDQAKKAAPSIIFIDELDAIGRQRGGGASIGGHDEREQTLNQILTEMDGFTGSEGVIVLAATNRPDVLDSALLRPGRFDRRLAVSPPDADGRKRILEIHTRSVPLDPEVDLAQIASTTPGMVGADLRNLVNEAALIAARRGHDAVKTGDITDAFEKIVLGAERRITLSHEERERTAYHEGGHALLGMLEPGADPVRKVSIVPRGRALGVTFQSPDSDRYGYDADYLLGRIVGALGGRAAEEIVYGTVTTGAESDLQQVTNIAKAMVGRWGMSEKIGLVTVVGDSDGSPLLPGVEAASEATREIVDQEVRRIVEQCYERALSQLREHRSQLDSLAKELLARETLDEADAYAAAGFARGEAPGDRGPEAPAPTALDEAPQM